MKGDLQEATRQTQSGSYHSQPTASLPRMPSWNISPPGALKRPADRWDQDDIPPLKRPRSGASPDEMHRMKSGRNLRDERRMSLPFATRSPPHTESVPGSAHPRNESPGLPNRASITLPSPSSMANPPSAAPSVIPPTAHSVGSPATSYQPQVSIHTASANSATSAHIADLQHQVTLKSLALQTLQSEYASLLQKLQRERVKSQTIEKKTNVADQEVNDLTSRNEELTEQIKQLETQLEDSEKKRETERTDSAKEKEQWLRMLDMGGRLHSKNAEEKQKLKNEKYFLHQRMAAYDDESFIRSDPLERDSGSLPEAFRVDPGRGDRRISHEPNPFTDLPPAATSANSTTFPLNDAESLKSEISILKDRIELLYYALEDARQRNQDLADRTQDLAQKNGEIGSVIDRALQDSMDRTKFNADAERRINPASGHSTLPRDVSRRSPNAESMADQKATSTSSDSTPAHEPHKVAQATGTPSSISSMASAARAVSPGPAELGFHVPPSTSTPEELIKALGPVPAPLTSNFVGIAPAGPHSNGGAPNSRAEHRKRPGKPKPWHLAGAAEQPPQTAKTHLGSFRPLQQPMSSDNTTALHAEHEKLAPHSRHRSPDDSSDDRSPISSGSGSIRSPAAEQSRSREGKVSPPTTVAGSSDPPPHLPPPPDSSKCSEAAAAMPPPPRPVAYTADIYSTADRGLTRS